MPLAINNFLLVQRTCTLLEHLTFGAIAQFFVTKFFGHFPLFDCTSPRALQ